MYIVHGMFLRWLRGAMQSGPPSLRRLVITLLAKVKNASKLDEFRGIALLSVMAKCYMASLMILLREHAWKQMGGQWTRHLIFGFEEGHNTEQIIVGLTLLVQRAVEWSRIAHHHFIC